jgi:hypothetical protein
MAEAHPLENLCTALAALDADTATSELVRETMVAALANLEAGYGAPAALRTRLLSTELSRFTKLNIPGHTPDAAIVPVGPLKVFLEWIFPEQAPPVVIPPPFVCTPGTPAAFVTFILACQQANVVLCDVLDLMGTHSITQAMVDGVARRDHVFFASLLLQAAGLKVSTTNAGQAAYSMGNREKLAAWLGSMGVAPGLAAQAAPKRAAAAAAPAGGGGGGGMAGGAPRAHAPAQKVGVQEDPGWEFGGSAADDDDDDEEKEDETDEELHNTFSRKFGLKELPATTAAGAFVKWWYAVKVGRGGSTITTRWEEASALVTGYPNNEHKRFRTLQEAKMYLAESHQSANERAITTARLDQEHLATAAGRSDTGLIARSQVSTVVLSAFCNHPSCEGYLLSIRPKSEWTSRPTFFEARNLAKIFDQLIQGCGGDYHDLLLRDRGLELVACRFGACFMLDQDPTHGAADAANHMAAVSGGGLPFSSTRRQELARLRRLAAGLTATDSSL